MIPGSKIQGSYSATTPDPTTLAAGASMSFELVRIDSDEAVRLEARVGSGTTIVEIAVGSDV